MKKLLIIFFGLTIFITTRYVPLGSLSVLANISLILIPVIYFLYHKNNIKKKDFIFFIFIILWTNLLFFYSIIFCGNDFILALRFFIIVNLILAAYFIKLPIIILKFLFYCVALQCLFLFLFEIILMFNLINISPSDIRYFFKLQEWGDVYSYNNFFYKIQLKGNALIPFVLFLSLLKINMIRNINIFRIIFFAGLIISGNFAYILGLAFFLFFYNFSNITINQFHRNVIILFTLIIIFSFPVADYLDNQISMKKDVSLAVRKDQVNVLTNNLTEKPFNFLFGKGIGNTINVKTAFRDYTDDIYFELQPLYFINQMGAVNFSVFLFLNVIFFLKKMRLKSIKIVYLSYIIYAVTNPYILDTNHVIVIISLITLDNYLRNDNRMYSSTL